MLYKRVKYEFQGGGRLVVQNVVHIGYTVEEHRITNRKGRVYTVDLDKVLYVKYTPYEKKK